MLINCKGFNQTHICYGARIAHRKMLRLKNAENTSTKKNDTEPAKKERPSRLVTCLKELKHRKPCEKKELQKALSNTYKHYTQMLVTVIPYCIKYLLPVYEEDLTLRLDNLK